MINKLNKLRKFWKNKKIFITGHTGFKGSWLVIFFHLLGAKISGYALKPDKLSLFNLAKVKKILNKSTYGDIRNYKKLKKSINNFSPDFLIHMAAQPLVIDSYNFPKYTYEVNTIGTINILNILKELGYIKNSIIVTTDKVYKNISQKRYFNENDILGGFDPYSNSKVCAELACESYFNSFFSKKNISCVTARAGNVIGGGDFSLNRIIPDYIRSLKTKKLLLRYPNAIRPWQHVIEPLYGYILLLMKIYKEKRAMGDSWNFGPKKSNNLNVKKIINILNKKFNNVVKIKIKSKRNRLHESNILMLDSNKSKKYLKWLPIYNLSKIIKLIEEWYKVYLFKDKNILNVTKKQILEYINKL